MVVNSIKEVLELISNLDDYKIKKIDYCYELEVNDYIIYFEDDDLEVSYKLSNPISIELNKEDIKYLKIIFKLLLINYLKFINK